MGFHKVFHIGQKLYNTNHKLLAKVVRIYIKIMYQCDIPLNTKIKPDVYFCHNAFGVVINENAVIRGGATIQHSVTIGEMGASHEAPVIEENVFIGARAIILGNIVVGRNAKIGAGAVVLTDVPANCTVAGVPACIVNRERES